MRHLVDCDSSASPAGENHSKDHPVVPTGPIARFGSREAVGIILDS
jgi:hypothetical protein